MQKGSISGWLSYGGNAESTRDYGVDTSAPTGTVYDGSATGVDAMLNTGSLSSLSANWTSNTTISGCAVTNTLLARHRDLRTSKAGLRLAPAQV